MSIVIVFFSSYRFLGRQRIGSVKVQVKLKCNARGYYTTPCLFMLRVICGCCSVLLTHVVSISAFSWLHSTVPSTSTSQL